jgi:transcription elongation GreA/GreB family factor
MSRAFTKEDDDANVSLASSPSMVVPQGPFRLTAAGAARLARTTDERVRSALARAEVLPPVPPSPPRASLGVTVRTRSDGGDERAVRLVTSAERGLLGEGCSVESPLGRALLGAEVGETREVVTPRGSEELVVVGLDGESK